MDKREFEHQAVAEPDNQEVDYLRSKTASAENQMLVECQRQADDEIKHAMTVKVPDGLAGRILLNQSLQQQQQRREWFKGAYAIAASVLLAVVILIQVLPSMQALDAAVLAHINDELNHLQEERNITDETLNHLIATFGGQFDDSIGQVNYAGLCNIRKGPGMHLVLQSEQGPVSVLIMPDEHIEQRQIIGDGRFSGLIIPAVAGSVAVIGEDDTAISTVATRLQNAISWNG